MNVRFRYFVLDALAVTSLLFALVTPCRAAGNLNLAEQQSRLKLAKPPAGAERVLTVQKQLVASKRQANVPKSFDVVVTGTIGGMPNVWPEEHPDYPWYDGQASFFVADNKISSEFAAHSKKHGGVEHCAYCRSLAAKNAHAIAVVNLVDEHGEILRVDARKLVALKENQTVVIRGKARLLAGRMLVIDADGIYAR